MFKSLRRLFGKGDQERSVPADVTPAREPFWIRKVTPTTPVDVASIERFHWADMPKDGPTPWLDRADAQSEIARRLKEGDITADDAKLCRKWAEDGFVILEGFYSADELDAVWDDYEAHIADGRAKPPVETLFENDTMPGRLGNGHFYVDSLDRMLFEPRINQIISVLLGAKSRPFQTIVGHKSSQQLEHSDSIHMTTYPNGYLAATWVAFEDVDPGSGPLIYYPGSQKLPYILSDEVGIAMDAVERAERPYGQYHEKYEPAIQALIKERNLPSKLFIPKKGDVLLWHANLLHGGTRITTPNLSRKALVCHYFAEGCLCYHDLSGSLAHIHKDEQMYQYARSTAH